MAVFGHLIATAAAAAADGSRGLRAIGLITLIAQRSEQAFLPRGAHWFGLVSGTSWFVIKGRI